jgi:hypothetical protein
MDLSRYGDVKGIRPFLVEHLREISIRFRNTKFSGAVESPVQMAIIDCNHLHYGETRPSNEMVPGHHPGSGYRNPEFFSSPTLKLFLSPEDFKF